MYCTYELQSSFSPPVRLCVFNLYDAKHLLSHCCIVYVTFYRPRNVKHLMGCFGRVDIGSDRNGLGDQMAILLFYSKFDSNKEHGRVHDMHSSIRTESYGFVVPPP